MRQFRKKQRKFLTGFTLLGLMIAAAISIVAIAGTMGVFVSCMIMNDSNTNLMRAASDAQYILEEAKALAYDAIDTYTPNAALFNTLPNEAATITVTPIDTRIKTVTANISWTEKGRSRNFALTTRFAR